MNVGKVGRKGSTLVEFTLVGIPVIFILISIFEISRGVWLYHTLAYSIREGTRFAVVHGHDCVLPPSNCATTVGDIADRIRQQAVGFVPSEIQNLKFKSSTEITCTTLQDCLGNTTYFPSGGPGQPGGQRLGDSVEISAEYPFRSAIAMFWPGAGRGMNFGTFMLPASSKEMIQY